MKGWKRILCIVLVILLALIAGLLLWQRENLKAVVQAARYSTEELEEQLQENEESLQNAVEEFPGIRIRPMTEEEKQAIRDGTLSWEEVAQRMVNSFGEIGGNTEGPRSETGFAAEPGKETPPGSGQPGDPAMPQLAPTYDQELSLLIAEIYALRESYTGQLSSMWAEASNAYRNLPEGKSGRSLVGTYMDKASAMEKSCDATMDQIVSRMRQLIKENQGDESLVDTVIDTYANEKNLKKAWYMSQLNEKGLS